MKKIILIMGLLLTQLTFAGEKFKLVNFNIMCDFCGNPGTFDQRLGQIADTIKRHNPDLMSLQEFSFRYEITRFLSKLPRAYYALSSSYADPVLLVSKDRYEVREQGGFWLGPNPYRPIGWMPASLPRRVHWARLFDKKRRQEFIFVGTHFDNSDLNKVPSATMVNKFFRSFRLPIIFAGDTNIASTHQGYPLLLGTQMEDTFPGLAKTVFYSQGPYQTSEACAVDEGADFPSCRIDHVLINKDFPYTITSWGIDLYRYAGDFVSDHRAVIVEFQ